MGLNPCCSGRWSRTNVVLEGKSREFIVLILVVVEDGLVLYKLSRKLSETRVLILVVVEDGLVLINHLKIRNYERCLNPCCSGRWSRTLPYKTLLIINKLKSFTKETFTFLNRNLTIS